MEFQFTFIVYPLEQKQAADLRERLQALLLAVVEAQNLHMGPLVEEEVQNGQGEIS